MNFLFPAKQNATIYYYLYPIDYWKYFYSFQKKKIEKKNGYGIKINKWPMIFLTGARPKAKSC